jgi:tetratricopeptide (TPR) repeat protein
MRRQTRKTSVDKSINVLFPNREAWNRFRRTHAYKAILEVLRTLENNESTVELWGRVGKGFFENSFSDPGGDCREKFNRLIESRLGEATWRFWAYAYLLCEVLLSEEATTQKNAAKKDLENYKDYEADYEKAIRILTRLHEKKYIIYPYPFFITQKKPVLESSLKAMWRKKQLNVFIYFMVGIPLSHLSRYEAADLLWKFFFAYLPAMFGDPKSKAYRDIEFIKKATERSPF